SSHDPRHAPINEAGICQRSRCHCPRSSRLYPHVPDTPPATRPTAFDIVAVTGGSPSATKVGNVIRVPEPTTALIAPARTPARAIKIMWETGIWLTLSRLRAPLFPHPHVDPDR